MAGFKYDWKCPSCGTALQLKMRVTQTKRKCPHCGHPITPEEIDRQGAWKGIGCLAILVFLAIMCGYTRCQMETAKNAPPDAVHETGETLTLGDFQYKVESSWVRQNERCARGGGGCWPEAGLRMGVVIVISNVGSEAQNVGDFEVGNASPFDVSDVQNPIPKQIERHPSLAPGTTMRIMPEFTTPDQTLCRSTLRIEQGNARASIRLIPKGC
jgi:hypothetical protein